MKEDNEDVIGMVLYTQEMLDRAYDQFRTSYTRYCKLRKMQAPDHVVQLERKILDRRLKRVSDLESDPWVQMVADLGDNDD